MARVEALEKRPDFDGRNPNRLRALYGAFAGQNPVNFHARDGGGLSLSRASAWRASIGRTRRLQRDMLAPLTRWRRYDAARRTAMRDALRRIESVEAISRDSIRSRDESPLRVLHAVGYSAGNTSDLGPCSRVRAGVVDASAQTRLASKSTASR